MYWASGVRVFRLSCEAEFLAPGHLLFPSFWSSPLCPVAACPRGRVPSGCVPQVVCHIGKSSLLPPFLTDTDPGAGHIRRFFCFKGFTANLEGAAGIHLNSDRVGGRGQGKGPRSWSSADSLEALFEVLSGS